MQQGFWQERWQAGQIGFHQKAGYPELSQRLDQLELWLNARSPEGLQSRQSRRVLVPLCGKSLDLEHLAGRYGSTVGVEFVEQAAQDYVTERGLPSVGQQRAGWPCYGAGKVDILVGDFFRLTGEQCPPVDRIYDRAALVAIDPSRRVEYAAKLAELAAPGSGLLLISFEHDLGSGPPFAVPEVESLLSPHFELERREGQDILAREPRFAERGATFMREIVWFGRRTP